MPKLLSIVPNSDLQADAARQTQLKQQENSDAYRALDSGINAGVADVQQQALYRSFSDSVDSALKDATTSAATSEPNDALSTSGLMPMSDEVSPFSFEGFSKQLQERLTKAGQQPVVAGAPVGGSSGQGATQRRSGGTADDGLVPDQYGDARLSADEAYAACGPAAAVAFARANGRNPTLREATDLAKKVGWTPQAGMAGPASQKLLLDRLGVPSRLETAPDWGAIAADAGSGKPVTISTPQHYFVADGYDTASGQYHVGKSGTALRGGSEWMTADDIARLGRGVNGALFIDHPLAQGPSTTEDQGQMGGEQAVSPAVPTAGVDWNGLVPFQYDAGEGLNAAEANAACGPAAAVAFARANGRNPSLREALQIAKQVGWTPKGGMNGIDNQKALLDKMGVPNQMEEAPNWTNIRHDALNGNPVAVSTNRHYFVVDGYDPNTDRYHVGNSGVAVARFGGTPWMSPQQIDEVGDGVNGALYVDHPLTPEPSLSKRQVGVGKSSASSPEQQMGGELDDTSVVAPDAAVQNAMNLLGVTTPEPRPYSYDAFSRAVDGGLRATDTADQGVAAGAEPPQPQGSVADFAALESQATPQPKWDPSKGGSPAIANTNPLSRVIANTYPPTVATANTPPPAPQPTPAPAQATEPTSAPGLPAPAAMPQATQAAEPPVMLGPPAPPTGSVADFSALEAQAEQPRPIGGADTQDTIAAATAAAQPVVQYNERTPGGLGTFRQVTKNAAGNFDIQPAAQPTSEQEATYNANEAATHGFTSPDVGVPLQPSMPSHPPAAGQATMSSTSSAVIAAGEAYLANPTPENLAAFEAVSRADNVARGLNPDGTIPNPTVSSGAESGPSKVPVIGGVIDALGKVFSSGERPGAVQWTPEDYEKYRKDMEEAGLSPVTGYPAGGPFQFGGLGAFATKPAQLPPTHSVAEVVAEATSGKPYTESEISKLPVVGGAINALTDPRAFIFPGAAAGAARAAATGRAAEEAASGLPGVAAREVAAEATQAATKAAATAGAPEVGAKLAAALGQAPAEAAAQLAEDTVQRLASRAVLATNESQLRVIQRMVASLPEDQQLAWKAAVEAKMQGAPSVAQRVGDVMEGAGARAAEAPAAGVAPVDSGDLSRVGEMGNAIAENLHRSLYDSYLRGSTKSAGAEDALLQVAQRIGPGLDRPTFDLVLSEAQRAADITDPAARQQALRDVVDKWKTTKAPALEPEPVGASPAQQATETTRKAASPAQVEAVWNAARREVERDLFFPPEAFEQVDESVLREIAGRPVDELSRDAIVTAAARKELARRGVAFGPTSESAVITPGVKPDIAPEPVGSSMGPGTAAPSDIGIGRPSTGDGKLDDVLKNLQDNYLTRYEDITDPSRLALKAAASKESLREAQGGILESLAGVSAKDAADAGEILAGRSARGASDAAFAAANKVDAVRQVVNNIAERFSAGGLGELRTTMQGINEDAIPALLKVSKNAAEDVRGPGGVPSAKLLRDIQDWHEMTTGSRPTVISPKELQQFIQERGLKGVSVVTDPGVIAAKYVSSAMTPMNDLQFAQRLKKLVSDAGEVAVSSSKAPGLVQVPNVSRGLARALTGEADSAVWATPEAKDAILRYSGRDVGWGVAQDHPKVAAVLTAAFDKPKTLFMQIFTMNPFVHISRLVHEALSLPDATIGGLADMKAMTASASARMDAARDGLHFSTGREVAGKLAQALEESTDIPILKTGHAVLDATLGRLSDWNHRLTMATFAQDMQMAVYSGLKAKGMSGEAAAKVANLLSGQLANADFGPITNWVRSHVASTSSWSTSRITLVKTALPGLGDKGAYLKGLTPEEQRMVINTVRRAEATKVAGYMIETGALQQVLAGHFLPTAEQIKSGHALDIDSGQRDPEGRPIYLANRNFEEVHAIPHALMRGQEKDLSPGERAAQLGSSLVRFGTARVSGGILEDANLLASLYDRKLHPYLGSSQAITPREMVMDKMPYIPGIGHLPLGQALAMNLAGIEEKENFGHTALPPKFRALAKEDAQKYGRFVTDPEREQEISKAVAAYRLWQAAVRAGNKDAAAKLQPNPDMMKIGSLYSSAMAVNPAHSDATRTSRIQSAIEKKDAANAGPMGLFLGK
jgi:hypothetical protein